MSILFPTETSNRSQSARPATHNAPEQDLLQLRPNSPLRPVNWRWRLAGLGDDACRSLRLGGDRYLTVCRRFQAAEQRGLDIAQRLDLYHRFPDLADALEIYRLGAEDERIGLKYELEARLLTSASLEDLVKPMRLSVAAATWYEALFFNVRDSLDKRAYILQVVIGKRIHTGLRDSQIDLLWKLLAYMGDTHTLDEFIDLIGSQAVPSSRSEVPGFLNDRTRELLRRKAFLDGLALQTHDAYTRAQILELQAKVQDNEAARGVGARQDMFTGAIQKFLEGLVWTVGGNDLSGRQVRMIEHEGHIPADEPRAGTLLANALVVRETEVP